MRALRHSAANAASILRDGRPPVAPVLAGAWGESILRIRRTLLMVVRHRILKGYEDYVSVSHDSSQPIVGIVMGSDSDWSVMEAAAEVLDEFGIPYEADVVSAHRMPGGHD